ncbi:MAG: hypothetical protein Q4B26_21000 [Eubacteriales bacterium]|nr:hypothetical protein [Eubacteriales bacterium]
MKKLNVAEQGFEGCLLEAEQLGESKCLILNLMLSPHSIMMKKTERWLVNNGISVLSLASCGTKQTVPDENLIPLEYILEAASY